MAESGHAIEHRLAPPVYRRTRIVTLSNSSKQEIVGSVGPSPPAGVGHPAGGRATLLARAGSAPPSRWWRRWGAWSRSSDSTCSSRHWCALKPDHPDLEAVIAGEGYDRPLLESQIRQAGAESWISLPGYLSETELIDLYRRAWLVASTSLREGWGMTVTEAGACGTPAVVSRISGHEDAVRDGVTGLLVDGADELVGALDAVLRDDVLRKRLSVAAVEHAARFTWDTTARGTLAALGAEALARS